MEVAMALSEKEQELLAQMEAALAADDPRLANTLRGQNVRTLHRTGLRDDARSIHAGAGQPATRQSH